MRDPGGQSLRQLGFYNTRVSCNSKLDFTVYKNILDIWELNPWKKKLGRLPCPAFSKSSEPGRKSHSSWTTAVLSTQITKHRHSEVQMTKLIQKDRSRHHDSGTPAGPTQVRCVPELTFSCCWLQSAIPNSNKHTPLTKKLSELSDHVAHLDPTVWLCRIWELKIGPAQAVGRAVSVSSTG